MSDGSNPKLGYEQLAVGHQHQAVVVEDLSRTQIVQYAGASGDFNPIHHDEVFATKAAGYPSVFAHGMLTMGLTGKMLTEWLGDNVLAEYGVRFVKQVWPGDTLTAHGTVREIHGNEGRVEIDIETRNQAGDAVVKGSATAMLPARV